MKLWDATPEFCYPTEDGTWTIHEMEPYKATICDNRGRIICRGLSTQDKDVILRAVNAHDELLAALRAFVPESAMDRGQTFEDRERLRKIFRTAIARATGEPA